MRGNRTRNPWVDSRVFYHCAKSPFVIEAKHVQVKVMFKDAMPVYFRSELFSSYILTIFKQRILLRKYEKLPYIVVHAWKNITKKCICENVWPANLALFVYFSTHCVETVKWLDYNRYSKLTRWCSGNASAFGARVPGFKPRSDKGFYVWFFLFCSCCVLRFCPKTHYL